VASIFVCPTPRRKIPFFDIRFSTDREPGITLRSAERVSAPKTDLLSGMLNIESKKGDQFIGYGL
jgi:hypothetical protein